MKKNTPSLKPTKTGKIATKILLSVITIILIFIFVFSSIIIYLVNKNVGDLSKKYAQTQVEKNISDINEEFQSIETLVHAISAEVSTDIDPALGKENIQYLRDYSNGMEEKLRQIGLSTNLTNSIYIYFNHKYFGDVADCWVYTKDFVRQPQVGLDYFKDYYEWYNAPVDKGVSEWTFPYAGTTEGSKGSLITSYVTPITKDGQIIGMVGIDLNLKDIETELNSVTLYKTGYLYLMAPDGRIIIHKKYPWEDTNKDGNADTPVNVNHDGAYASLLKDMNTHDSNTLEYPRSDKEAVIGSYGHLSNGWILGSSIPKSEVFSINNTIIKVVTIISLLSIIIALIVSFIISKSITKPILIIVDSIRKMKDGDFTTTITVKSKDETKVLADSVNDMAANIRSLIKNNRDSAQKLVDSSTNLASMAEETNATIDQVDTTMNEISRATHETAEEAEDSNSIINAMDKQLTTIISNSKQMYEITQEITTKKISGLEAIETLKKISKSSAASNEKISNAVSQLDSKTKAISDIISTINAIAEQTNLLALNAFIEAARAGEAGRGFAVVAEEIRTLAENSGNSAEEIRNIILSIQSDSKETVDIMKEVNQISSEQNNSVSNVGETLDMIFEAIDEIISQINVMMTGLTEVNNQKNNMVSISTNLSAVSEETAAATEEVNSSMNDQTHAMEEVAKSAEMLNQLAQNLNEQISVFKIDS